MEMESQLIERYRKIVGFKKGDGNSSDVSSNESDSNDDSVDAYDGFACTNVTNIVGV